MTLVNVIMAVVAVTIFVGAGYATGRYVSLIKYAKKLQEAFDKGIQYGLEKTRWLVANGYLGLMDGKFFETPKYIAFLKAKKKELEALTTDTNTDTNKEEL